MMNTRAVAAATILLAFVGCAKPESARQRSADRTVVITMRDIEFEPKKISVRRGENVFFRFVNRGEVAHDAFIGDAAAQRGHESEMRMTDEGGHTAMSGSEEGDALTVEPDKTGELTYLFNRAGTVLIGCHEPGHYKEGMIVKVKVT